MAFRKVKAGLVNGDIESFVGEIGNLFFDIDTGILRLSDGITPGGTIVSGGTGGGGTYTLPTATTTVKGGVKIDGTTINIANQVISVGTVPYSSISGTPSVPTTLSQLTNDTGFITGVTWDAVTSKPTLFSGAYADLTGKPTNVSSFTNDSGYLTSSSLSSYATQSYVTSRGYITSSSLPTAVSELSNDSGYLTTSSFDLETIDLDANNKLHATGVLPGDEEGFTAIFAGRAAGIAALPNTVIQSQAQVNDYAQNNFQNTNDGNHASTEWVATSPNGSDTDYYIDLGINGASWDGTAENSLYDNVGQRDGWLYVQGGNAGGGNLVLGTSIANTYTKIIAGDVSTGNREVARFSATEVKLSKQLTFSDNTTQTTAWTGSVSYNDLTDTPTMITSYNDLTDLPTLVTSYNQLTNLPTLFSGAYADLTGKPTLFSGSYNDLTNKPVTVQSLSDLSDVDLTTPPTIGQVLKYDGTKWAPGTDITAGGSGTDADTLDGFDSTYFLNYNNFTNKPTIPTTVTINGTALTLGSSGTITANTTNTLTIGYGLSGTASTFDGSTANTVKLDTSTTTIAATAGATLTLAAATLTRNYVITGSLASAYTIKLPDITTLNVGQVIRFFLTSAPISIQLSSGTLIYNHSSRGSNTTTITYTVLSIASNVSTNLYVETSTTGLTGTGTSLVSNVSPSISTAYITNLDSTTSTNAYASTPTLTLGPTSGAFTHTQNIGTAATTATYAKTLNLFTNLNGGTGTINIATGVTSGTSTLNIGSTTTTTTMNGAVTITSLTATNSIVGSVTGNAATATKLGTARAINGVNFDGSAAITITASNPNALTIGSGLSGTSYDGSTAVTIAVDSTVALRADTHYIGTTGIALNRTSASQTLTGVSIDGNAATVTNGVYTTGTYSNPAWITSLAYSKLTGTPTIFSGSYTDLTNKPTIYSSAYIGTTSLDFTRVSGSQTLTGISIDGNAATVTNGLYSTGSYSNPSWLTSLAYSKLTGAPTVPTNVSELTNDSGYVTNSVTTLSSLTSVGTLSSLAISNPTSGIALSISAEPYTPVGTQTWTFRTATGLGIPYSSWINFPDGTNQYTAYTGNASTVTNGVYTTDTGTVTNTMLAGSIANNKLANSSITINGSSVSLGSSVTVTAANPNALTIGTGLSGTSYTGSAAVTIAIDSTVATLTGSQTLTNKTLTLPTIGGTGATFNGSTSGTTVLKASATAGTTTITMPATTGTVITTGDTGTVTNAMLAGSIATSKITGLATSATTDTTNASNITSGTLPNARLSSVPNSALANSSISVNGTSISLGGSGTITVNSISASGFTSALGFDAGGSLILTNTSTFRSPTGLTIQTGGPSFKNWAFDTSGSITFPDSTVQTSAWTGLQTSVTGNAGTATKLATARAINGTNFDGSADITVTAAAGTLTGTTLNSTVVSSSLTSVGTLTGLTSSGAVSITNNTNSSSVTTGALKITGGAGIGGNVYVGGSLNTGSNLDVTGSITASANITASNLLANATNAAIFNTTATTVGIGGVATTLNLGASTGTATINNPTVVGHSANTTVNLWNTVATTVNFAGAATTLSIGAGSGTTTINNDLSLGSSKTISTTGSITSNNTTAFIAGANAASNIALQLPSEAAIRNLTNGATNMYFDVSIGGSTQGQFQFRSSSGYTNVLTMSTTGVTFNTDATFTSRTPSVSRTAFNSAIDTEITVDSMRFRISNQGGIFPQVIGNGSSRNLAWTGVGAISGAAIAQVGSTGTIVSTSAWTTLYNSHGMDAAGDTVTVTLQDKAAGRIYRITFMRSDNGSTTGYNIIGERIL